MVPGLTSNEYQPIAKPYRCTLFEVMSTNTIIAILSLMISLLSFTMAVLSEKAQKKIVDKIEYLTLLVDSSKPIRILISFSNTKTSMYLEMIAYTLTGFIVALCLLLFEATFYGDYTVLLGGSLIGFLLWGVTYSLMKVIKRKSSIIVKRITGNGNAIGILKRIGLFFLLFGTLAALVELIFDLTENSSDNKFMWVFPILIAITIPYAICLYILLPPILLVIICFFVLGVFEVVFRLLSKFLWWCVGHKKGALVIFAACLTFGLSLLINILKVF